MPVTAPDRAFDWLNVTIAVYFLVAAMLLARLVIGTLHANRLRRSAAIVAGHVTSSDCATPITVGWLSPVMILPRGWQRWSSEQLNAVVTHERAHIRRRDPLVQWLALLNRALFWFHPLAWWLERRLATLAEEACDIAVLAAGHAPDAYANYLLSLARSVSHDGRRVRVVGTTMPGSGLRSRLGNILSGTVARPVSRVRAAGTLALCLASSGIFAAGTLTTASAAVDLQRANAGSPVPLASEAATVKLDPQSATAPVVSQKSATAATFDVVSIKACQPTARALMNNRGGLQHIENSANRLYLECITLKSLANLAYNRNGDFVLNEHIEREVRGGPDWTQSDRFTVEAKTTGSPTAEVMMGSMLRALLEDRFQLKVHKENDEIPMYALTVASGGLKIKPIAPGDCVPDDDDDKAAAALQSMGTLGSKPPCGAFRSTRRGSIRVWDLGGAHLGDLTSAIDVDRQILDRTGIKDRFNLHLEYETDEKVVDGINVFAALEQQLGLKLVSAKGPHQFIVIDRVERPRPD
jgi:uncharacterized protein (TIGR03435 family)